MGVEHQEGTPRRLNWWHQTLDYMSEDEEKKAELMGGLNSSVLPARSPPARRPLPPSPARRAPAPPQWPRSPVELLDTAE